jgi:hypothetical protein
MNTSTERHPGDTILPEEEKTDTLTLPVLCPSSVSPSPSAPPMIVLGSADVNEETLFRNGLTQNIIILFDLFESLGYVCYLLQGPTSATAEKRDFIKRYRPLTAQEMVTRRMNIRLFVEIGMSLDPATRQYLRSTGAKITKLYLGNILNIDIETIQYQPSIFFHHHIVGDIDEIWTSPHYRQHLDFAAIVNRTDPSTARTVPYVWDSCFLTRYLSPHQLEWQPPSDWRQQDLVVMDPSISFQKCSFYSLLLAEAFSKRYPEWKGTLHVINGDRLQLSSHARNHILPSLSLFQKGRIRLYGRKRIHDVLTEYRSACFLTHQWCNDYNYLTLELMYCQYPILHNSEGWSAFGYYYSVNEWDKAVDTLFQAVTEHIHRRAMYRTHAAQLAWKHSIHNPVIRERWKAILDSL